MAKLALFGGTPQIPHDLEPYPSIGDAEMEAVAEVMGSGCLSGFHGSPGSRFNGGPKVQELEKKWAARYGVAHAVSANSATSCLQMAMGAIELSPGDEVIVPPLTMSATAVAPLIWGGIPVFADVSANTFCIDPARVREAISDRTRAIIAVNLFGAPAELAELRAIADENGLYLIEDSAQAPLGSEHGRLCGTVGHIGVYSLNYHKHIHSGEGGICVTDDDRLARRLSAIRNHGENVVDQLDLESIANIVGFNFRMTEVSAAVASVQLADVDRHVARREEVAELLSEATRGLPGWTPPYARADTRHNYYMWSVRFDESAVGVSRELMLEALVAEGVPVEGGYVNPLYRLPLFRRRIAIGREGFPFTLSSREYPDGLCPVAEALHDRELIQYQPPSWDVDLDRARLLADGIHKVYDNIDELRTARRRTA